MPDVFTTGWWKPFPGQEEEFVEAWVEFGSWASGLPGAGTARLTRDLRDPEHFVSFMEWESIEAVRGWKGSSEFKDRMSRVQKHVHKFSPTELELVASAGAPR
jgi:heme-degrading monooxygenase HmoA